MFSFPASQNFQCDLIPRQDGFLLRFVSLLSKQTSEVNATEISTNPFLVFYVAFNLFIIPGADDVKNSRP